LNTVSESLALAVGLVTHADANLVDIVLLSLQVSLSATYLAAWFGLPLGAAIAVGRFPGRSTLVVFLNARVDLLPGRASSSLLLSAAGPLAGGTLFTPGDGGCAGDLITPIIAAHAPVG
jgi:tungstate transport system permease protein